jgi:diguanylate cyclase (GGDEF)-like protein
MAWRLSSRIILLVLGLLLVVQAAGFGLVRQAIEANARQQIARELAFDERMWNYLLQQNAERLRQAGAALASNPEFSRAISRGHAPDIAATLRRLGGPQGIGIGAWLDPDLDLRALDAGNAGGEATMLDTLLRDVAGMLAGEEGEASRLALVDGIPYQFALLPVRPPGEPGWVLTGMAINSALVEQFKGLMDGQLAVLTQMPGGPLQLMQTTLPARYDRLLLEGGPTLGELRTAEGRLLARRMRMPTAWGRADTLLLRSTEPVVRPFRQLQALLGGVTLLGLVLFGIGMAWTVRRLTTPLRAVIAATERIGRGDYDGAPPDDYAARPDEVGELARALDRMRLSIAGQQAEMRDLAYRDRLTGLPNRLRLHEAVAQAIADHHTLAAAPARRAARRPHPVAVLTLDLDRFKHVNDVLGYAFGDRLLVAVAERMAQSRRRPNDMVARIGGNEFALLLWGEEAAGALARAQELLRAFEVPLSFAGQTVDLSAAIGIACWSAHADDADTLLGRSEVAMYAAKRSTAGVLLYEPSMESAGGQSLSLLTELRQALERDELRLFLQPQVDLRSGRVSGAEALVRWQHPRRGLLPPMEFIPFAEQTGFVRRITAWVLEEVARRWHGLQPGGAAGGAPPVRIAVNLSVRELLDLEMPQRMAGLLGRHAVPPQGLCLEITEGAMMDDPQRTEAILRRLAALGLRLSIDDFGTGYSSLAYLKRLPVHELKIDRSFVMGMQASADDAVIVRSTIDLAHNLGLQVVAEGVEDDLLYRRLLGLDCDEAQGYHIGRPMPAADFAAWHAGWKAGVPIGEPPPAPAGKGPATPAAAERPVPVGAGPQPAAPEAAAPPASAPGRPVPAPDAAEGPAPARDDPPA